jgi:bacteriocin-like protein
VVLHNNGCTGIDQPNNYSRRLKMTKHKQMTQKELDQVSGGPHYSDFNGRPGVIGKRASRNIIVPDYKVGSISSNPTPHPAPAFRNVRGVVNPDSM